jgi:hypothetical protein
VITITKIATETRLLKINADKRRHLGIAQGGAER